MYGSKLAFALAVATVIGSCAYSTPSSAQTTDGPTVISRCKLHRDLGVQIPPKCGGPPAEPRYRCGPRKPGPADDQAKATPRSGPDVAGQKGATNPTHCGR